MKTFIFTLSIIALLGSAYAMDLGSKDEINDVGDASANSGNFRYDYIDTPMWFGPAQEYCRRIGANLASINSPAEQAFITTFLASRSPVWLGYIDVRSTNVNWGWIDGKGGYANWASGRPHGNGEMCTVYNPSTTQWHCYGCNEQFRPLCKQYRSI